MMTKMMIVVGWLALSPLALRSYVGLSYESRITRFMIDENGSLVEWRLASENGSTRRKNFLHAILLVITSERTGLLKELINYVSNSNGNASYMCLLMVQIVTVCVLIFSGDLWYFVTEPSSWYECFINGSKIRISEIFDEGNVMTTISSKVHNTFGVFSFNVIGLIRPTVQ
jgi:hypothetical protein